MIIKTILINLLDNWWISLIYLYSFLYIYIYQFRSEFNTSILDAKKLVSVVFLRLAKHLGQIFTRLLL